MIGYEDGKTILGMRVVYDTSIPNGCVLVCNADKPLIDAGLYKPSLCVRLFNNNSDVLGNYSNSQPDTDIERSMDE